MRHKNSMYTHSVAIHNSQICYTRCQEVAQCFAAGENLLINICRQIDGDRITENNGCLASKLKTLILHSSQLKSARTRHILQQCHFFAKSRITMQQPLHLPLGFLQRLLQIGVLVDSYRYSSGMRHGFYCHGLLCIEHNVLPLRHEL